MIIRALSIAGSDPSGITTVAVPSDSGGYLITGEKWFVTSGDVARVLIVVANVVEGGARLSTLFLVEPGTDGVEFVDDPPFTHSYPHGHPTIRFTGVVVRPEYAAVLTRDGLEVVEPANRRQLWTRRNVGDRARRIGVHVGTAVSRDGDYFGRNVAMAFGESEA